jgi:hypothetical protein
LKSTDRTESGQRGQATNSNDNIIEQLDQFMAATDHAVANNSATSLPPCLYHWPVLQLAFDGQMPAQVGVFDHYQVKNIGEQASLFLDKDGGLLSTHKDCTCWMLVGMQHQTGPNRTTLL